MDVKETGIMSSNCTRRPYCIHDSVDRSSWSRNMIIPISYSRLRDVKISCVGSVLGTHIYAEIQQCQGLGGQGGSTSPFEDR